MKYRKITVEVVVNETDYECVFQRICNDLEYLEEHHTIYSSEVRDVETVTPANADEMEQEAKT